MASDIKKSILSGIMICIGCSAYLGSCAVGLSWFGAVMFTIGLFTICVYGFNLYTGKVGYIGYNLKDLKYIKLVLLILLFNLITTFLGGLAVHYTMPQIAEKAASAYASKLECSPYKWLLSSILCGMLMFIAVDSYKKGYIVGMFLCVPAFIMAGFDHSIANMFYNAAGLSDVTFTLKNLAFIVIVILGNALGGMLIPLLQDKQTEKNN